MGLNALYKTEKQQMIRMNNFFCGLHYLVGLAECTDKALSMWEFSLLSDNAASPPSSSSTQRLVHTACKAFHHYGSQQCGTSTLFRSYEGTRYIQKTFGTICREPL